MSDNADVYRDTAERIFAETLTIPAREAAEADRALPQALWGALGEAGVWLTLVPEEAGGVGATLVEAVAITRAAGAAAAPGPIVETMTAAALAARAGLDPVSGAAALIFTDGAAPPFHAVAWGGPAGRLILVHPSGEIASVLPGEWAWTPGTDASGEPRDRLSDITPSAHGRIAPDAYDATFRTAAVLRAGQMLGALEWVLQRTVDYAMERKQFGRELGRFQAVQQMLAELAGHVLASSAIVAAAAEDPAPARVAAARARLADACDAAVAVSHQVHGAMGFSREYPLNYRTRRLMAWRDDLGGALYWRRRLARAFVGLELEGVWPAVAAV